MRIGVTDVRIVFLTIMMWLTLSCSAMSGSLSFSRPGVVFLPAKGETEAKREGGGEQRRRDSEISVVLRFDSERDGTANRTVRFALSRDGGTVPLAILDAGAERHTSVSITPDTHTSLTLAVPTDQIMAWRKSIPAGGFENWSLYLIHDGAPRGILVGTVRVAQVEDENIRE